MNFVKSLSTLTFATLALVTGCGQSREASETTADTTAMAPAEPPAADTPAWVSEVRQGEAQLGQTIEQGRLGEVHDQAVKLQEVLKLVANQAGNLAPQQQQQLTEHLGAAGRVVDELHDVADAGDLTKTKAKFQEFKTHLRAIEGVLGVTAP